MFKSLKPSKSISSNASKFDCIKKRPKKVKCFFLLFFKKGKFSTLLENFRIYGNIAPDYESLWGFSFYFNSFSKLPSWLAGCMCWIYNDNKHSKHSWQIFYENTALPCSKSGTICSAGRLWRKENSFVGSSDLFSISKPLIKNLELSEMGSQDQNRLNIAEQNITWDYQIFRKFSFFQPRYLN